MAGPSGYIAALKLLAKLAAKGGGKVPKGVKGVGPMRKHQKGLKKPKDMSFSEWLKQIDRYKGKVTAPYQKRNFGGSAGKGGDSSGPIGPSPWPKKAPKKGKASPKRRIENAKRLLNALSTKGKKNPFTHAKADKTRTSQRPLPNEEEAHLIARMKAEYSNTPQGPPVSTPLGRILSEQAKKGKKGPRSALKRLEISPEKLMAELAGGSLYKNPSEPGPIKLTEEELRLLEEHFKNSKTLFDVSDEWAELLKKDMKDMGADPEYGPMGPGSANLNAALLSALGGGAGAAGLGGALRNRSRGSAGGGPQSPSR
tara:strand:- start:183 stop:1118 length:936 start_codon:yes stop_codon:yes gene_type:complete